MTAKDAAAAKAGNGRPWALITGASAGIGAVFARKLARDGMNCVLVARRRERLEQLAAELKQDFGSDTRVFSQDLGVFEAPKKVLEFTDGEGLEIHTLINNAGYGTHGEFCAQDPEWEMKMVDLNCRALVGISHMYAPRMKARRQGNIVHLASVASFQACPYMATYGATKAFILMFSEALWAELKDYGVHVTALCPGPTQSEFFAVAGLVDTGTTRVGALAPTDAVVEDGLGALKANKPYVVSGFSNYVKSQASRFVPRWLATVITAHMLQPAKKPEAGS
ncbi:MAG: SDR family oxidoreductase [Candidatus Wallbacteria bacterium]|nr:SDR family oxidoreductase [Candidatus Wallbacteria bacterium]